MTTVLVVLQNAYDKGSLAEGWSPARWRKEYESSRSGRRLQLALPSDWNVRYTNTTPVLGNGPDSRLEPDLGHLRRRVRKLSPDIVLACGKPAEAATLKVWPGALVAMAADGWELCVCPSHGCDREHLNPTLEESTEDD